MRIGSSAIKVKMCVFPDGSIGHIVRVIRQIVRCQQAVRIETPATDKKTKGMAGQFTFRQIENAIGRLQPGMGIFIIMKK